ncbi:putative methylated DNA-protein cysteine methyltransferase [Nostoc sp. PCC 7524]|uniref:MGMT family protein n=1 Tax=Nostoc sp. (strain ATCC 29411 / PCC 7524) TaxID=28072 RepID=UPI00029F4DBD|nr:MGMT family protein [Nostoc sp. PCC 7524]AFY47973.1 putative methylated DNA-protein cysteine methyltransferase [Nostoc sp. PCC 7524]
MPKSSAFIQIKQGVLEITSQIPVGRITTYNAIGEHLNVMARHVAYILATLNFEEQQKFPWYRVVADQGIITVGKLNSRYLAQIQHLKQEGIELAAKNHVENFNELFCSPVQLVSWNHSTKHYLDDLDDLDS